MASDTDHDESTGPSKLGSRRQRIQRQIEFYLSDGNLSRDQFFAREMQSRADGGISIQLLLNCHRLQMLEATEELVIRAVQKSPLLQLSADGKAVLRSQPVSNLPAREKRTVLVVGIPRWSTEPPQPVVEYSEPDEACLEPSSSELCLVTWQITDWLREVFSEFGQVLYVQLPHFQSSGYFRGFAFVEFSDPKEAKAATNAFRPNAANQLWFVSPCGSNAAGRIPCPELAWKPRMAAKATFAEEDMLARRYIWRCCSRKNKQMQSAMRQLRAAGYRAPNPFNREYELITIGAYSPDARQKHLGELFGAPQKEKLCVFRYSTWQFWKSKFYEWHHAWIERMRRKTDELSIDSESVQPLAEPGTADQQMVDCTVTDVGKQADVTNTPPTIPLPRDFVPGSVVQICWPSGLVREPDTNPTVSDAGQLLPPPRPLSLARRIRISLEQHLLAACNLLDQVAHVDPTPNDQVVTEVSNTEPGEEFGLTTVCSNDSPIRYPVFVRFKTKMAAHELIKFTEQSQLNVDNDSPNSPSGVQARILSSKSEEAYCRAIAASMIGSHERRRRIQQNRRQRIRHQKGDQRPSNPEPMAFSDMDGPASGTGSLSAAASATAKHIVFDA